MLVVKVPVRVGGLALAPPVGVARLGRADGGLARRLRRRAVRILALSLSLDSENDACSRDRESRAREPRARAARRPA